MEGLKNYFEGVSLSVTDEEIFLKNNGCKNTVKLADKYVSDLLKTAGIKFKKNLRIPVGDTYIIPDLYLPDINVLLEIKSRGYNSPGTATEKIDNIPRKYSKIMTNNQFKNTKVIVVFCAYETINKQVLELVNQTTEYAKDFTKLCRSYNVDNWILVQNLIGSLPNVVKPFIKWVGGKSKLKELVLSKFPRKYNKYHEPFIGGGCIGMSLGFDASKSFSDINWKLINCYNIVKYNVNELTSELSKPIYLNTKDNFYLLRERFNEPCVPPVELAAIFIYLNKCCFNGMYRENKSGNFNVPFGNMKSPVICDSDLLGRVSNYLQNVDISCKNVFDIAPEPGDLVYLDPPYHLTFSDYSCYGFGDESHVKLRDLVKRWTQNGVHIVLSNSATDFVKELYSDFNIETVKIKHTVSCGSRPSVEELLITNYFPS
jgi:DNA adenine methylase